MPGPLKTDHIFLVFSCWEFGSISQNLCTFCCLDSDSSRGCWGVCFCRKSTQWGSDCKVCSSILGLCSNFSSLLKYLLWFGPSVCVYRTWDFYGFRHRNKGTLLDFSPPRFALRLSSPQSPIFLVPLARKWSLLELNCCFAVTRASLRHKKKKKKSETHLHMVYFYKMWVPLRSNLYSCFLFLIHEFLVVINGLYGLFCA